MLTWLNRRPECGRSCNTCKDLCPVQAIGDDGAINLNECYQCLTCQVAYHDSHVCPPLVSRRERLERLSGGAGHAPRRAAAPAVK
jgi:polyferredoxin